MSSFAITGTVVEGSGALQPNTERFLAIATNLIERLSARYGKDITGSFMLCETAGPFPRWIAVNVVVADVDLDIKLKVMGYDRSAPRETFYPQQNEIPYPWSRSKVTRVDFEPIALDQTMVAKSFTLGFAAPAPLSIGSLVHLDLEPQRLWRVDDIVDCNKLKVVSVVGGVAHDAEVFKGRLYPALF